MIFLRVLIDPRTKRSVCGLTDIDHVGIPIAWNEVVYCI